MQCDIHQFAFNFINNIHCVLNYFKVDSLISTTFLSMNRFLFFRNDDPLDRSGFRLCKNVCEVEFSQRKNKSKKLAGNGSSPSKREAPGSAPRARPFICTSASVSSHRCLFCLGISCSIRGGKRRFGSASGSSAHRNCFTLSVRLGLRTSRQISVFERKRTHFLVDQKQGIRSDMTSSSEKRLLL